MPLRNPFTVFLTNLLWLTSCFAQAQTLDYDQQRAVYCGTPRTAFFTDFKNRTFQDTGRFSCLNYEQTANFFSTHFQQGAVFQRVWFQQQVHFTGAQFLGKADFNSTRFSRYNSFLFTEFMEEAFFGSVRFDSIADLNHVRFRDKADFGFATFNGQTLFTGALMSGPAYFHNAKFNLGVDFSGVDFQSSVNFNEALLGPCAQFTGAAFGARVYLTEAILPDTLLFNQVKDLYETIDFTACSLDSLQTHCLIDLVDTDISKIKLQYNRFQLYFPPEAPYNFEQKSNVYEQLLKVQAEHGFTASYEKLDKEYHAFQYLQSPKNSNLLSRWVNQTINFMQRYWWDYGYNKPLVFVWIGCCMAFFTLINWLFFRFFLLEVYTIDKIKEAYLSHLERKKQAAKKTLEIRLTPMLLAFYYTALIFFGLRVNTEQFHFSKLIGVGIVLIQYTSGLVCLAYAANLVIQS